MSDAPEGGNTSGETPAADGDFKPITSQEEFEQRLGKRLERERGKFADYDDLKAKAARLDEIEKANQTEAERAQARLAELEAELSQTRSESLRLRIATEHGITDADDIRLFLTGADEETLAAQAKRLVERTADRKKAGPHVPREGATPSATSGDEDRRSFVRQLTGRE